MTTKPLDPDDEAMLAGCGAFFGAVTRNVLIASLYIAAISTDGVLSGVLWSLAVLYTLTTAAARASRIYKTRRPRKAGRP